MTTERRVYEAKIGPIRARLIASGGALALFDPKYANEIVRASMRTGGQFWIDVFLPKRFSAYAFRVGYRVSKRWREEKEWLMGSAVPFVGFTPPGGGPVHPRWKQRNAERMETAAIGGANVRATATSRNASVTIRIPHGHAVRADTAAMFRTIPSWEVERIAQVVGKALEHYITSQFMSGKGLRSGAPKRPRAPARGAAARAVQGVHARLLGVGEPRQVGGTSQRSVA